MKAKLVSIGKVAISIVITEQETLIEVERDGRFEACVYERVRANKGRHKHLETNSARDDGPDGDVSSCLMAKSPNHFEPTNIHEYSLATKIDDVIDWHARRVIADAEPEYARQLLSLLMTRAAMQNPCYALGSVPTMVAAFNDLS